MKKSDLVVGGLIGLASPIIGMWSLTAWICCLGVGIAAYAIAGRGL